MEQRRILVGTVLMGLVLFSPIGATATEQTAKGCFDAPGFEEDAHVKKKATFRAKIAAIETHDMFLDKLSAITDRKAARNSIISAMLATVEVVEKPEYKPYPVGEGRRGICAFIRAKINPSSLKRAIEHTLAQNEIVSEVDKKLVSTSASSSLRVRVNHSDGYYQEGDPLIIRITSDRGGYIRVDYYMSNRKVVHLVPNVIDENIGRIKAGDTFFGCRGASSFGCIKKDSFKFNITHPFGPERIVIFFSPDPFNPLVKVSDSRNVIEGLVARGVEVLQQVPVRIEDSVPQPEAPHGTVKFLVQNVEPCTMDVPCAVVKIETISERAILTGD